ncbi:MAG: MCE family protein [Geobacter sp.]|nr:MCE family protein [Geobacter sp.]
MKRSDNIAWSQVKVGMLIVAALTFFAGGIILLGEKTKFFVPKGELTVVMTDVAGLKEGAPVWLAGVDVGIVTDIHFDRPRVSNEVDVVLEIEREALKKIGRDSVITVKTRGLLGEKYVDITPSRFVMEKPETRLYGTPAARVEEVMQKAGDAFQRLNKMMDKMGDGKGSLGRLLNDPELYDNMAKFAREMEALVSAVNRGEGSFGKFVHDPQLYNKLVSVVEKSEKATDDLRELNQRILSPEGTVGKLITDREFYDRGVRLMERTERSLAALEETVTALNKGEGTAGKLVKERELYDKMNRAVEDIDALVKDIKANPRRYIKLSVF